VIVIALLFGLNKENLNAASWLLYTFLLPPVYLLIRSLFWFFELIYKSSGRKKNLKEIYNSPFSKYGNTSLGDAVIYIAAGLLTLLVILFVGIYIINRQ
jgi:hypothetical protein